MNHFEIIVLLICYIGTIIINSKRIDPYSNGVNSLKAEIHEEYPCLVKINRFEDITTRHL